jgi:lipopolysaccharide/colanic/teichoic acid biosynthesis glycosyltransferase
LSTQLFTKINGNPPQNAATGALDAANPPQEHSNLALDASRNGGYHPQKRAVLPENDVEQSSNLRIQSQNDDSRELIDAVRLDPVRPRSAAHATLKRLQDVIGSSFLLLILSPALAVIALAIKLQDRGSVIYRRRVVGPSGEFDAFKFRSMRVDADSVLMKNPELWREYQKNFKLLADPRVTKFGAWLRKLSLDELPQLVNVLLGQMSLVGPRMITAPELAKYGAAKALLLSVKPGLTGYWQVHGRQEVDYSERVRMDMFYIQNWSLALDFEILLRTPIRVLKGTGAY